MPLPYSTSFEAFMCGFLAVGPATFLHIFLPVVPAY